jgi:hypothetical protein
MEINLVKVDWEWLLENNKLFTDLDYSLIEDRYNNYYLQYGHSEQSVGWGEKGRQMLRYEILLDYWDLKDKKILEAMLYGLKYKGCSISEQEIEEIKKLK